MTATYSVTGTVDDLSRIVGVRHDLRQALDLALGYEREGYKDIHVEVEGVMYSLASEGAELIFNPAVTFGAKSQRMWHLEFPVDAARHNVFIGGSNRKGSEPPWNQPYFGESYFCGPNGTLKNLSTHPELVIADVDLGELAKGDSSGWNLPRDIRHELYSPRPPRK